MPLAWVAALEADAPDVVACWRAFDWTSGGLKGPRAELGRANEGSAPRILAQLEATADQLEGVLRSLPEPLLRVPGGEEDWNVAQAFAHTTSARRFLPIWAALDVDGSWPADRPPLVRPSVPGRADAGRDELLILLEKSRRALRVAAARMEGHERQRCRLYHPLIGHLRCGEWLLFVGTHDCMHLEQLHRLAGQPTDA